MIQGPKKVIGSSSSSGKRALGVENENNMQPEVKSGVGSAAADANCNAAGSAGQGDQEHGTVKKEKYQPNEQTG